MSAGGSGKSGDSEIKIDRPVENDRGIRVEIDDGIPSDLWCGQVKDNKVSRVGYSVKGNSKNQCSGHQWQTRCSRISGY